MSSDNRWYDKFCRKNTKQQPAPKLFNAVTDFDCCSVCHEQFTLPCQSNCAHWFCGECILRVWEYGSALLPCKCPICRQPITRLWPTEFPTTEDASNFMPLLTDIATYNLNFDSRIITILRRWLHWTIFQLKFPDTDLRLLHLVHLFFLLVLAMYMACLINLILEGKLLARLLQ